MRRALVLICVCGCALAAAPAGAQQPLAGYDTSLSFTRERIGENHWKLTGAVELERGDTRIYADQIEIFTEENRAIASGNVVFSQGANRIAAERADFNTSTRLGTFYNATGIATVQPQRQRSAGSLAPPPVAGQDTDVYFYGETVEKIGPKKYRITNGGFTTCVQPTPRWDLASGTIVLNIDHYTLLRQSIFKVKGVPLLYLPILYYPTKREAADDRIPASDLRLVDGARADDPQRVLLGHQSEPGRDVSARLVLEDRPGSRQRVPVQPRDRGRQSAGVPARSARVDVHAG